MKRKGAISMALAALTAATIVASSPTAGGAERSIPVSGSGVDLLSAAIVHSQEPTPNGMRQQATESVRLWGDMEGYVLYHVTSEFDFTTNTLVNTGTQFFSGTIAGSDPVVLHDNEFRFVVDLTTGAETGEVHFRRSQDAPHPSWWYECDLVVVGTGLNADGDPTFDYSGDCTRKGNQG